MMHPGEFEAPPVFATKTLKQSRTESSSGVSRKNKLQRCSLCGGLGHKSRTCDQSGYKMGGASSIAGFSSMLAPAPTENDSRTVIAAYGLLTLSSSQPVLPSLCLPLQTIKQQQPQANIQAHHFTASPPCSPSTTRHRQPLSPRLLAS